MFQSKFSVLWINLPACQFFYSKLQFLYHKYIWSTQVNLLSQIQNLLVYSHFPVSTRRSQHFSSQSKDELPHCNDFFIFHLHLFLSLNMLTAYLPQHFSMKVVPSTFWSVVQKLQLVLADFVGFVLLEDRKLLKTPTLLFSPPIPSFHETDVILHSAVQFQTKVFPPNTYALRLNVRYLTECELKVNENVKSQGVCTVLCSWDVRGKVFVTMSWDVYGRYRRDQEMGCF